MKSDQESYIHFLRRALGLLFWTFIRKSTVLATNREETADNPATVKLRIHSNARTQALVPFFEAFCRNRGYSISPTSQESDFSHNDSPLVIGPALYTDLPEGYYAVQLEPLGASPLLSFSYLEKLWASSKIWDYSAANVDLLLKAGFPARQVEQINLCPVVDLQSQGTGVRGFAERDIDILFFGWTKSKRRREALAAISEAAEVVTVENTFGDEMDELLSRSKVVLNIHFYEDSDLEQVRLAQCFVAGTPVVSEKTQASGAWSHSDSVSFVEIGDWSAMGSRALELVSDVDKWNAQSTATRVRCHQCASFSFTK